MSRLFPVLSLAAWTVLGWGVLLSSPTVGQEFSRSAGPAANRVIKLQTNTPSTANESTGIISSRSDRNSQTGSTTPSQTPSASDQQVVVPSVLRSPLSPNLNQSTSRTMRPQVQAFSEAPATQRPADSAPRTSSALVADPNARRAAVPSTNASGLEKPLSVSTPGAMINTTIEAPGYINLNRTATLRINLQNVGQASAGNVKLIATLPAHVQFARATPAPSRNEGRVYEFQLSNIEARQSRTVAIEITPTEKKPLDIGTEVVIENTQRIAVSVRQPKLKVSVQGPAEANMGQTVMHQVLLENTGDGLAEQIQLKANFPSQLHCSKKDEVTIPSLQPGQAVVVEMPSLASAAGQDELGISVAAIGVDPQSVKAKIRVYQPELEVSIVGPKLNFLHREGIYTITLDNTGEVDASNVMIELSAPAGMQVTTISREAQVDSQSGVLAWNFERIPSKTEQTIRFKALATKEGEQVCNIMVQSKETRNKAIRLATAIVSRAELNVSIQNVSGPVQVGGKATFMAIVENKGSSGANDIVLNVELPEALTADQQDGIAVLGFGNTISFQDAILEPGQKREFVFSAISNVQGEHVVRGVLQAAGSEQKMVAEGSVYVYEVSEARVSEALSPAVPR